MDPLMKDVMIHGAESYIYYIANHHKIAIKGLEKSLEEWKEQEF